MLLQVSHDVPAHSVLRVRAVLLPVPLERLRPEAWKGSGRDGLSIDRSAAAAAAAAGRIRRRRRPSEKECTASIRKK